MSKWKRQPELEEITKKADELAARHWKLAASDREQSYKKWLKCCKKSTWSKLSHDLP